MSDGSCNRARREILGGAERVSDRTARHLVGCVSCAGFAARFTAARAGLREHRIHVEPDGSFAARVTASLPRREGDRYDPETMGWAALRLLPAALTLALLLGVWAWRATASPASLAQTAPTDDVLAWVLENGS